MQRNGKVISVFGYYLHRSGVSTVALSTSIVLSKLTNKKTLLINLDSTRSMLERYIEKDICIRHSLDDIRIYAVNLNTDVLENYSDIINDNLHIISKSKEANISLNILERIIEEAKKAFDFVIIDLGSMFDTKTKSLLDISDSIVYVTEYNEALFEEINTDMEISNILRNDKTEIIFNKFPLEYSHEKNIAEFKKSYMISNNINIINYDIELYTEACCNKALYSFIVNNFEKDNAYTNSIFSVLKDILRKIDSNEYKKLEQKGRKKGWKLKIF